MPKDGKKRLWRWASLFVGASLGNLQGSSSTRRMKGVLRMECLSLKGLIGVGLEGSSFTGDPGIYVKRGSRYGHLSPYGPFLCGKTGTWNAACIPGTIEDE
jgi:hypothetical protein